MRTIFCIIMLLACVLGINAQHGTFYDQRASLFDALPLDSTNIVFLGNSLTNGCEWHELFDNAKIVNRGISGDIATGVSDRLDSVVKGKPAKIFLMIGVNDVSHHISADSIATDITAIVDRIVTETPGTKLYIQSCLPFNESFKRWKKLEGQQQVIIDLNKRLEQLAKQSGATWINLYPIFSDGNDNLKPEYTNDGLHLLAPGYMAWKEAIEKYVTE